ncbi:Hypothetical protein SRAE_1000249800 [Strongyloides ratti]|uniref:Uncharacterized protein n=1 Tax=Strongyloides ratti TaxID=34506 RepID=A0A090L823_STRRB|nr:Hypothetical protein SRAE_1000249800 [Strongyloides ratti]CEF64243.1 Hypothetical protein SRAE_1000249800 [Strongyloides ratti]
MQSGSVLKKPKDANTLFKKFSTFNEEEKEQNFMRFLGDFYIYENKEIPMENVTDEDLEKAYDKVTFERGKAYTRILMMGQLIDDRKLRELLLSNEENKNMNEIIYQKIISLRKIIENLENVTSSEYPDLCKYIITNLKYKLYDFCHTKFNICDEITELIDNYPSENRIESHKIDLLPKSEKTAIYIDMNKKFHSIVSKFRFNYFQKPENFPGWTEIEKSIKHKDEGELSDVEEDEEEEDEEDDFYNDEKVFLNVESTENLIESKVEGTNNTYELIYINENSTELEQSLQSTIAETTTETSKSLKRSLVDDNKEIEIIGYGKSAKYDNNCDSTQNEIECISLSSDDE